MERLGLCVGFLLASAGGVMAQSAPPVGVGSLQPPVQQMLQNYQSGSIGSPSSPAVVAGCPGTAAGKAVVVNCPPAHSAFGVVQLTPGGAQIGPGRFLGCVLTAGGTLNLTLADGSTLPLPVASSATWQEWDFQVTGLTMTGGAAGTCWSLR